VCVCVCVCVCVKCSFEAAWRLLLVLTLNARIVGLEGAGEAGTVAKHAHLAAACAPSFMGPWAPSFMGPWARSHTGLATQPTHISTRHGHIGIKPHSHIGSQARRHTVQQGGQPTPLRSAYKMVKGMGSM